MTVSVIMVTMNRYERALRSLTAVLNQTEKPMEVVVVDSSIDSKLGSGGKKLFSGSKIRFHYMHEKASMTQARNIGIARSKGDIVLFIDDDVVLNDDYIEKMNKFYNTHDEAGGACGYLSDGNKFLVDRFMKFPHVPSMNEPFTIMNLHGSNMSFPRKVLREFAFHEGLKGYYADDDEFSARVSLKYKIYLVPYMRCVHEHSATGGARLDPFTDYNTMMFNRYYIYTIRKRTVFNFIHYIFSDVLILSRVIIHHPHKGRALSGAMHGYKRILKSMINNDVNVELSRL